MTKKLKKLQEFLNRYSDEESVECIAGNRPCDIQRDAILSMPLVDECVEVQFIDTSR